MRTLLFLFFLSLSLPAAARQENIQDMVIRADLSSKRSEQKELAEKGLQLADQCIERNPKAVNCYYYRGQARGLYYGNSPFGYAKRVRMMMTDWETSLKLDPTFNYGGPYRMFAELYINLPKYFGPKDLRQDLNKAIQLLEKAIQISDYPSNTLDMAEAQLKAENKTEAEKAVQRAKKNLTKWQQDPYFQTWQETLSELDKKLAK